VLTGDTLFIGDVGRPDLSPNHTPQQLAGLLMLATCALTYVAAGAIIAARWLRELAAQGTSPHGVRPVRQA